MIELTAYTKEGWKPRLRPAPRTRDWMDATSNKSGYWCLPLSMANAHGWEMLSPYRFRAMWNGKMDGTGVQIEILSKDVSDCASPCTIFGRGVLTFHVAAVFRTSPGYNLWVGSTPNRFKDGIQGLTGIVETDWAPYTFTMNWQFTRQFHWVYWEVNEPYCFIFPVKRDMVESVEPVIKSFDTAPHVLEEHNAWSESRNAFHKLIKERPPVITSEQWQKHYMRGCTINNNEPFEEHQTKVQLREFAERV